MTRTFLINFNGFVQKQKNICFWIPYTFYIGYKSLIWAAQNGRSDVVKLLLENGADVNSTDDGKSHILLGLVYWDTFI